MDKKIHKPFYVYVVFIVENSSIEYLDTIHQSLEAAEHRARHLQENLKLDTEIEKRPVLP